MKWSTGKVVGLDVLRRCSENSRRLCILVMIDRTLAHYTTPLDKGGLGEVWQARDTASCWMGSFRRALNCDSTRRQRKIALAAVRLVGDDDDVAPLRELRMQDHARLELTRSPQLDDRHNGTFAVRLLEEARATACPQAIVAGGHSRGGGAPRP